MRVNPGIVPGFFTMANMFCGFFSALMAAQDRFLVASWLIVAAAIWDTLDGKLARFTGASSSFGEQYDSMADVVSFGLAPSMLAYFVFFEQWGTTGVFLSFIPLVFGSIRLARFNVRLGDAAPPYFEGLPIPAAASSIAAFVMFNLEFWDHLRFSKIFLGVIILVSLLMISAVRYEKMPRFSMRGGRAHRLKILTVVVCTVLLFTLQEIVFIFLALGYVVSGPARVGWLLMTNRSDDAEDDDIEYEENNE